MNIQSKDTQTAALPATCVNLDLDLSTLRFLDSSGLGTLVSLHKTLRSRHGAVRLIQPAAKIRRVLELTQLHRVFEITP